MAGSKNSLPSDRKFLMARTAEHSLAHAILHLKVAVENFPGERDLIGSDACRKALVKATTAHLRARDVYHRENLRVAEQLELEGAR